MNLDHVEITPFVIDQNNLVLFQSTLVFVEDDFASSYGPSGSYEPRVTSATILRRNGSGMLVEDEVSTDELKVMYNKLKGRRMRIDFWCMTQQLCAAANTTKG